MSKTIEVQFPWPEPQLPSYRAARHREWSCSATPEMTKPTAGYFRLHRYQPPGWMLRRKNQIWMSLTQMELESHMPHIAAAHGHVVICGLGMGMVTYNICKKPEVVSVTVVEKDPSVIALMDKICPDWRFWSKLKVVEGDALDWRLWSTSDTPVDFLYIDIWRKLGSDDAEPMTQAIQRNVQAAKVGFWGQELEYFTWCIRQKLALPDTLRNATYRQYVNSLDVPLIGLEWPRYARFASGASVLQTAAAPGTTAAQRQQIGDTYCQIMGVKF